SEGNFQMGRLGQTAEIADGYPILEAYISNSSFNHSNWSNDEYIALMDEAKMEVDSDKVREILGNAEEILMEEMPVAPIYYYQTVYTHRDYVHDVDISGLGFAQFKWAYLTEE